MTHRLLTPLLLTAALAAANSGARADEKWTTFENCTVDEKDYRDGDSLHVKNEKGREYIFRLYFVDAPETNDRFPDRLAQQGEYFGGLTPDEVIRVGEDAAKFTDKFLSGKFTVHTRYHDALGGSSKKRYYAIIEKDGVSLAEALVERGYARIFGVDVTPPGAATEKAYLLRLKGKENEARKAGLGGWAKTARGRGQNARGAAPAAWRVEEQDATTRVAAVLQSASPPHGVTGTLPAGTAVRVLGASAFPTKVRVRFGKPDGTQAEALCERSALGL